MPGQVSASDLTLGSSEPFLQGMDIGDGLTTFQTFCPEHAHLTAWCSLAGLGIVEYGEQGQHHQ